MTFSKRHGYEPDDPEITIRLDAPYELRGVIVDLAYESKLTPHQLRSLVCQVLRTREDPSNWSAFPNVDSELRQHLDDCRWHEVYDVIEAVYERLRGENAQHFQYEINNYFRRRGIGWQLVDGQIETRGDEVFEHALDEAKTELTDSGRPTAANEMHEAIRDLSRRPAPDVTGAIQHALAALECVAREIADDRKATFGVVLSRNPDLVPAPLNLALEKLWGFASEQGRHLREGRTPSYEDAELVVQVSAAVARYLSKKTNSSSMERNGCCTGRLRMETKGQI